MREIGDRVRQRSQSENERHKENERNQEKKEEKEIKHDEVGENERMREIRRECASSGIFNPLGI